MTWGLRAAICALLTFATAFAADPAPSATPAEPYLRLRDATIAYHGTSEDFADLREIRLGWFGPSDPTDPLQGDVWWAANFAVTEANATLPASTAPGIAALPVRLLPCWSPDPWGSGVSKLARMVYDEQPLALLGSIDSASTHLAEQIVTKANLPLVSPFVTDKTATLAGVSWMFSCAPDDTVVARTIVDAVMATGNPTVGAALRRDSDANDGAAAPVGTALRAVRGRLGEPAVASVKEGEASLPSDTGPHVGAASRRDTDANDGAAAPVGTALRAVCGRLGEPSLPQFSDAPSNQSRDKPAPTSEPAGTGSDVSAATATARAPLNIILLATTDHESRMTAREIMRELSRRGIAPRFRFDLPPGTVDATAALQSVADRHPAAVLVIADAADCARLTRAVRIHLGGVAVIGGTAMGRTLFLQLAGDAAVGVHFPLLFAPDPADGATARFIARFIGDRGHAPDFSAALTYDATRLLIAAIRRAGPNRARIREALVELSPWAGIAGLIAFDGTGQNRRPILPLGTIRDGRVVAEPSLSPPLTLSP